MTIGTAIVASTKVRRMVDIGASQSLRVTLSSVRVGNTHSQIISASWWRLGGAGRGAGAVSEVMAACLSSGAGRSGRGGRSGKRAAGGVDGGADELGVDRDRG